MPPKPAPRRTTAEFNTGQFFLREVLGNEEYLGYDLLPRLTYEGNMMLVDLIARHHPNKDEAIKLIAAIEQVVGAAESYAEDWETGMEDGTYDNDANARAEYEKLSAALDTVNA